jgi:hypothetical protein
VWWLIALALYLIVGIVIAVLFKRRYWNDPRLASKFKSVEMPIIAGLLWPVTLLCEFLDGTNKT